jgi:hypothetical protein
MNDHELRRRIAEAHRDDAPPPFAELAHRRRRPRLALALVPLGAALAAMLALILLRPTPPPPLPFDGRGPLDFLLHTPGEELLRETPRFDQEGVMP